MPTQPSTSLNAVYSVEHYSRLVQDLSSGVESSIRQFPFPGGIRERIFYVRIDTLQQKFGIV